MATCHAYDKLFSFFCAKNNVRTKWTEKSVDDETKNKQKPVLRNFPERKEKCENTTHDQPPNTICPYDTTIHSLVSNIRII